MRGERSSSPLMYRRRPGSSPHARGTLRCRLYGAPGRRFIPACAGNAPTYTAAPVGPTVHPRMRGERIVPPPSACPSCGSSPHARGTPPEEMAERTGYGSSPHARGTRHFQKTGRRIRRFIPACAGNAPFECAPANAAAVHPRMRGERVKRRFVFLAADGSSPHARGTPLRWPVPCGP